MALTVRIKKTIWCCSAAPHWRARTHRQEKRQSVGRTRWRLQEHLAGAHGRHRAVKQLVDRTWTVAQKEPAPGPITLSIPRPTSVPCRNAHRDALGHELAGDLHHPARERSGLP